MKRIGLVALALMAALALSAGAASSASALCLQVAVAGDGNLNEGCEDITLGKTDDFIKGSFALGDDLGNKEYCAKVEEPKGVVGYATLAECKAGGTPGTGSGWIRIKNAPEPKGGSAKAEFKVLPTARAFKGSGEDVAIETGTTEPVTCTGNTITGELTGARTVGAVAITFSGCSSREGSGCSVKSPGVSPGTILTKTLKGELGTVKESEALSEVGLLIGSATGKTFATLEGTCLDLSPSEVEGLVTAEVMPVNEETLAGQLRFVGARGLQSIKSIAVLSSAVKPRLMALGLLETSVEMADGIAFEGAVEVV
jgi:hypothetical protein